MASVQCPVCDHSFSLAESLRIVNPVRFTCCSCSAELTTGRIGYAIAVAASLFSLVAAVFVGSRYRAGDWTLTESIAVVLVLLVVVLPLLDYIATRFVPLRHRK